MSRPRLSTLGLASAVWLAGACGGSNMHAGSPDAGQGFVEPGDATAAPPDLAPPPADHPPALMDPADLVNLLSPLAWQAGGGGTTFATSSPCGDQGCSANTSGVLCTRGHIAALSCESATDCDFATNWGAMIGINLSPFPGQPWGSSAAKGIGVIFAGGPGEYRLTAHLAGDPAARVYCIDNYPSERFAEPPAFLTECWNNAGDALPSYALVDQLGLQIISAREPIDFDFCISGFAMY
jgi:hypothetical protein